MSCSTNILDKDYMPTTSDVWEKVFYIYYCHNCYNKCFCCTCYFSYFSRQVDRHDQTGRPVITSTLTDTGASFLLRSPVSTCIMSFSIKLADFLVDSTDCLNCSGNSSFVRSATYSASTVSKYPSCLWYDVWSWSCHLTKPSDSLSLNKIHCWCYPLASWCIISDPLSGCYTLYSLATFHLYNCC